MNDKQIRFCEEYLIDFNATQAAIRAGYSSKTAGSQGHDLLKKPEIQSYIKELFEGTGNKLGITRERVMQEIGRLAFADIRKIFSEDGSLKLITELDDDAAATLSSIEVDELFAGYGEERMQVGQTKKVKVYDKTKALEMLAKHFKIYTDAPVNNNYVDVKVSAAEVKEINKALENEC